MRQKHRVHSSEMNSRGQLRETSFAIHNPLFDLGPEHDETDSETEEE